MQPRALFQIAQHPNIVAGGKDRGPRARPGIRALAILLAPSKSKGLL